MKNIALITLFILLSAAMGLAQTRVEKKIPSRATGNGVTYFLPKTSLIYTVEVTKTTCKAGQFFFFF
jgi:hypothetical protein